MKLIHAIRNTDQQAAGGQKEDKDLSAEELFEKIPVSSFTGPTVPDPSIVASSTELTEEEKKFLNGTDKPDPEPGDKENNKADLDPKAGDEGDDNTEGNTPKILEVELTDKDIVEQTSTFHDLANEIKLRKLNEDSIEEFVAAIEEKFEELKTSASIEITEEKYGKDGVNLLSFLEEGGDLNDFFNPVAEYYEMLVMPAEKKVREAYKLDGKADAWIDTQIDKLKEDGKFDAVVNNIDNQLHKLAKQTIADKIKENNEFLEQRKNSIFVSSETDNKRIIKEIEQRKDFNGVPISDQSKQVIKNRWLKGEYRKAFESDPIAVTDYIMNKEFGDKVKSSIKTAASADVKAEVSNKLHNLSDSKELKRSAAASATEKGKSDKPFASWNKIYED
jgi:hypothetical protein